MSLGIVKTTYGLLSGVELSGTYAGMTMYKGIPFAQPPVGNLRWKAPQDPLPWDGVKECDSYAPICIQPTDGSLDAEPWASDFYYMGNRPQSEDCLYLNVTTCAETGHEKMPVFVWFHGGGSDHGYTYEAEFDPRELAKKGIVVVSVAQRLSMFGYLALPQLDREQDGHSGNYILLDNMKALEWIIANIEAFGGDPDSLTLGGQSAGTGKSSSLAYTPLAKGHVKRIINQSAFRWNTTYSTREDAEQACADYLTAIGIDPTLPVDELRKIDGRAFLPPEGVSMRIPGNLIADGVNIPHLSMIDTIDENLDAFDYLAGTNLGETHMDMHKVRGDAGYQTIAEFRTAAEKILGDLYDEVLMSETDAEADRESRRLASLGLSNNTARYSGLMVNRRFGAYRSEKGCTKKVFTYLFSRVSPYRLEDIGTGRDPQRLMSWHSNELWYMFHSLRENVPPCRPWEAADYELAEIMCSYWANFIKTGDPNGDGLPEWPESGGQYGYIELGDEVKGHTGLDEKEQIIDAFIRREGRYPR